VATHQEHLTKAEREQRIMDVYPLVVDGFYFTQIREITQRKCAWQAADRTLERYIAAARALVAALAAGEREQKFAEAAAFLERLRLRASMNGDLATALRVQCELNRLYGLLAPQRHEIRGEVAVKGYVNMDMEEL
jgi:hypothetical protein